MIECIKYDLVKIKNDCWLRDLAELIKPVSEIYCWQFTKDADDNEKSESQKFQRVTRELCEMLKFQKDECILQKKAFHASFRSTEFSEKNSDVIITLEIKKASSKKSNKS